MVGARSKPGSSRKEQKAPGRPNERQTAAFGPGAHTAGVMRHQVPPRRSSHRLGAERAAA